MNHTKEQWTVRVDNHDGVIRKDTSKYVVSVHSGNQYQDTICAMDNLTRREDAGAWHEIYNRIVRCVNACADVDDDKLALGYVNRLEAEVERLNNLVMMQNLTIAKLSEPAENGGYSGISVPLEDV